MYYYTTIQKTLPLHDLELWSSSSHVKNGPGVIWDHRMHLQKHALSELER